MALKTRPKAGRFWLLIPPRLRPVLLLLALVATTAATVTVVNHLTRQPGEAPQPDDPPKLGYAEGTVPMDRDSLQAAVDEMFAMAREGRFVTEYRNDAFSQDGSNFTCYVGNSDQNAYDMYIQIFADASLTDQLLLTGLLRPGTVFKEITLDHPLDSGAHRVYVVFTQVKDDLATIQGQVTVTMDFTVE